MKKLLKSLFILSIILSAQFANAVAFPTYATLTNIPGVESGQVQTSNPDLSGYLDNLYKMGVAAAAGLAVMMVIWGGIEYITSVAGEGKSGGKERISAAILGLLLALGSYIIVQTINPDLLKLSFLLPPANIDINAKTTAGIDFGGGVTVGNNGILNYNGQPMGYHVDSSGNIVDNNGNPASYINDTPLNVNNFAGSLESDSSGYTTDNTLGSPSSTLANSLAQSATNAFGQNLGQGTYQRVACASTTCSILNNVGFNYGNITTTDNLATRLSSDNRFQLISQGNQINPALLKQGDVIVTATQGENKGHTGVINTQGLISNNDSDTGLVKMTPVSYWNTGAGARGLTTYVYRAK